MSEKTTSFGYTQFPRRKSSHVGASSARSRELDRMTTSSRWDAPAVESASPSRWRTWPRHACSTWPRKRRPRLAFARRPARPGRGDARHQRCDARRGARQGPRPGQVAPRRSATARRLPFPATPSTASPSLRPAHFTNKDRGLLRMARVTAPAGRVLVLEFSRVWKPALEAYDTYSSHGAAWLGKHVAGTRPRTSPRGVDPQAPGPRRSSA